MFDTIHSQTGIHPRQIEAVATLLDDGATIPFIARYRKEHTGSLDEIAITTIRDALAKERELSARKDAILKSLQERELLTESLQREIESASTSTALEDLYQPYRPKKRTRAMIAREKGLEPLAQIILDVATGRTPPPEKTPHQVATDFLADPAGIKRTEAKTHIAPHEKGEVRLTESSEAPISVLSEEEALAGARDIVAETVSETPSVRHAMRTLFTREASLVSSVKRGKEEAGEKFKDYFDWTEPTDKAPSHRILAMLRGVNEGILTLHALPPEERAIQSMTGQFIKEGRDTKDNGKNAKDKGKDITDQWRESGQAGKTSQGRWAPWIDQYHLSITDGYKRLLGPAMENELIKTLKERADDAAIEVFAANVEGLLMSAPLGQKAILAVDPGFRTGCKVVCLDPQGALLDHDVIYPTGSDKAAQKGAETLRTLVKKHRIEVIAVGNGTAGRETEQFIRSLSLTSDFLNGQGGRSAIIPVIMVDESGASIYSASECAREEFPDHDITVRGAVSIGRRLMDPLAELVKIDPKSIGVGQYQHDVDQKKLQQALDDVVTRCVNKVGVELNTASKELLCQVAGLNRTTAGNIVAYRNENGPFKTRKDLLKVPRLGPKAFEQCAGFLRVRNGENPLDASGIHPECYPIVERMVKALNQKADGQNGKKPASPKKSVTPDHENNESDVYGNRKIGTRGNGNDNGTITVKNLMGDKALVDRISLADYVGDGIGMPTLKDIATELLRPGRDPRDSFKRFEFANHVHEMTDLEPGMRLPGIVTNVTAFGAFVDIGVHQDGLVHISQLADRFVKDPAEVVTVRQQVTVTVLDVDLKRKRISLSMKKRS